MTTTLAAVPAAAARPPSVLVKLHRGETAAAVAARHHLTVLRRFPQIGWVELGARRGHGARAAASALRADAAVRATDAVVPGEGIGFHFTPRDPVFNQQVTYNDDGTQVAWHFVKPNFPVAWDVSTGRADVRVAVIGSEFDTDNPDLKEKLLERYNAASGTAGYHTGSVKATGGETFHGSHTSGLVGARTDNGIGVAGACFDCGIMAIKIGGAPSGNFVDASFLGDVTEGILYAADHGASVISMSLGGPRPHAPLQDAVNYASGKGVVLVASAGNSQQSNPGVPNYPAAYDHVIGVGATDKDDNIAEFSTNGAFVDVAAPGKRVLSTTDPNDPQVLGFFEPAGQPQAAVGIKSGTSMAAPIAAGLAGLMRTIRPDLTPDEVESLMKKTARDLGAGGQDNVYGAGRIDAGAAMQAAKAYVRPAPPPPPPAPPAPAPVTTPPPDLVGPSLTGGNLRIDANALAVTVACPAGEVACTGEVVASAQRLSTAAAASRVALGTRSFSLKGGQSKRVRFTLSKKARKAMRKWRRARLTVTVKASDSLGNRQVTRTRKTIRPKSALR
ncbi:MAG: S8 family serine peptidase [Solirubrobacterales bacterium]|nr:S8 family serine peptidase [Solirubrobacterales bacterium]